jgi:hypothetical protein
MFFAAFNVAGASHTDFMCRRVLPRTACFSRIQAFHAITCIAARPESDAATREPADTIVQKQICTKPTGKDRLFKL